MNEEDPAANQIAVSEIVGNQAVSACIINH